ncbi:MAG: helix-turn-helix domain-containing protein [Planctomycetes bacterium]|nr:helix-turn-helix domain-containing protein [Planctomycetota bacterium]
MADWITLQKTADMIGVRKGTLAMWRTRNRFPFETQGEGRNLMVSVDSVSKWLEERKDKKPLGRKKARKKAGKKAVTAVAIKPRPGRPSGSAATRAKRSAPKKVARSTGCEIVVQGGLDLETIQNFVTQLQGGADLQISPAKDGYILRTV